MRILFMGTPDYATEIFHTLLEKDYDIVALFTQPDKPVGRKQVLTPPHIKKFCFEQGLSIPIYQPHSLKEEQIAPMIKSLKPDFIIVAAYGQILPQNILDIAPCINLHASLLPKYRGASPIQESILHEDTYTGVSAMLMDAGLDSGEILGYQYTKIDPNELVQELFARLATMAASLCVQVLQQYQSIAPKPQSKVLVSYCKKIKKNDGEVDFADAHRLYCQYRAYHFWPGVYLQNGLKLKKIALHKSKTSHKPGEILAIENEYILLGCTQGILKIYTVQPPSKKQMSVIEYIRGKRLEVGMIFH